MISKKVLWIVTFCLVFIMLAAVGLPAYASLLDDKRNEKNELTDQLAQERNILAQQRTQAENLQEEIKQLDQRLQDLRDEIAYLEVEIERTEEEIEDAEVELAVAEAELARQEGLFKRRLRAMHEQGPITYLEVLFNSRTFSDFLTRLHNLKIIASNDLRLVEDIQAERDRIQEMKDELERKRNGLEDMRRRTLANEDEIERTMVAREQKEAELQEEIARRQKTIQEMEQEAIRIDQEIRSLSGQTGYSGVSGKMHWPMEAPCYISSRFGPRSFDGYHWGLDIAPTYAYNYPNGILAAADGVVEFSGAQYNSSGGYAGYGIYIRINHGGGIYTVYGHMSARLVNKGDHVVKGQRIGRVGSTGNSTGPHLHFEVWDYARNSSSPRQNPENYL
ncbi:MAG: peptidoglycan DD-metalloendopeptidase family protein [Bacillota bacterium]